MCLCICIHIMFLHIIYLWIYVYYIIYTHVGKLRGWCGGDQPVVCGLYPLFWYPDSHGYQFYRKQYMEQKSSLIFQEGVLELIEHSMGINGSFLGHGFHRSPSNIQWAMASIEFQHDHPGYVVPPIRSPEDGSQKRNDWNAR